MAAHLSPVIMRVRDWGRSASTARDIGEGWGLTTASMLRLLPPWLPPWLPGRARGTDEVAWSRYMTLE